MVVHKGLEVRFHLPHGVNRLGSDASMVTLVIVYGDGCCSELAVAIARNINDGPLSRCVFGQNVCQGLQVGLVAILLGLHGET